MRHQWTAEDTNPLQQFAQKRHGMFLAVLRARKDKEDEVGLCVALERRKAPQDCYPWHRLQLPGPGRAGHTYVPFVNRG